LIKEQIKLINVRDTIISNCKTLELKFKIKNIICTIFLVFIDLLYHYNGNADFVINVLEKYLINNTNDNLNKFIICGDINIDISNISVITTEYQNISNIKDSINDLYLRLNIKLILSI